MKYMQSNNDLSRRIKDTLTTKELYSWLPCKPPVYKLFRDKPGSVVHYYTCIFVITRYTLNSAVRRKHPERY